MILVANQRGKIQSRDETIDKLKLAARKEKGLIASQVAKIKSLEETIEALKTAATKAEEKLRVENFNYIAELALVRKELDKFKQLCKESNNSPAIRKQITQADKKKIIWEFMEMFFTPAQIRCYMQTTIDETTGEKKYWERPKQWGNEDFSFGLTIRLLSPRAYRLLRDNHVLPLPGKSTLSDHFRSFQIAEGYFWSVHELLKLMAKGLSGEELAVALSLDEVYNIADISYDNSRDRFVGPHATSNVLLLRGIYKKFKIPIWFRYDHGLTKEELLQIIEWIESTSFQVHSFTSDMGPLNVRLFKELGLSLDSQKTWFKHPTVKDRNVFWFHDVPHLIKLCRNHLIDDIGFELKSGIKFGFPQLKKVFEELEPKNGCEVSVAPKLTKNLIYVSGQDKQRVKPACQLLSRSFSNVTKMLHQDEANEKVKAEMEALSNFVEQTNNFFDIFNSSRKWHKTNPLGNAFGMNILEQCEALDKYYDLIKDLRVWVKRYRTVIENGRKVKVSYITKMATLQPWQKGILICINSIKALFYQLKKCYGVNFLRTAKINQDALEQLFSILRAMCGQNSKFGALSFQRRLRDFILGAGKNLTIETANVLATEDDDVNLFNNVTEDVVVDLTSNKIIEWNVTVQEDTEEAIDVNDIDDILDTFNGSDIQCSLPEYVEEEKIEEVDEEELTIAQAEGFKYFAGYIAKKSRDKTLAKIKSEIIDNEEFVSSNWIDAQNMGRLQYPTKQLVADMKEMEKMFQEFHSSSEDGLLRIDNVNKDLASKIKAKFPQYDIKDLNRIVLSRALRRMKILQVEHFKVKESLRSKRKKIELGYSNAPC